MTNEPYIPGGMLSLSALRRIDERTEQFETDWNAGRRPKIEDYLDAAREPERTALFRELLLSELELRKGETQSAGETPHDPGAADEISYQTRFPQYHDVIRQAWERAEKNDANGTNLSFLRAAERAGSIGKLGPFEVERVIGKGGFGVVLRARDEVLGRAVAIKVISSELAAASQPRKRFLREVRAAGGIRHDNVVQVYAVAEEPVPYLVMEFIEGENLQQRLDREGPLELQDILRVSHEIACGLAAAHSKQIVHRDIKPANILIEAEAPKRAKLTDFGLARILDDSRVSQSGLIGGTPAYMAPEQAHGDALDCRADLFSLGSVMYIMCVGQAPFRGPTTVAILKRVVDDTPRPIRQVVPQIPRALEELIGKLHAKKPQKRIQSAQEVADALAGMRAELLARGPNGARPKRHRIKAGLALVGMIAVLCVTEATGLTGLLQRFRGAPGAANFDPPPLAIAPFDAEQAKEHQEAWAKHLGVPVEMTNSIGMKLRLIPPGEPKLHPDVRVGLQPLDLRHTRAMYASIHKVTVANFRQFVIGSGYVTIGETRNRGGVYYPFPPQPPVHKPEYIWSHPQFAPADDVPVTMVSWHDAKAFCDWLSKKEGRPYRFTAEAEYLWNSWAGSQHRFYYGDDVRDMDAHAWVIDNSGDRVHSVGKKNANPWGLFDVYGNVFELCYDWYAEPDGVRKRMSIEGLKPPSFELTFTRGSSYRDARLDVLHSETMHTYIGFSHVGFRIVIPDLEQSRNK